MTSIVTSLFATHADAARAVAGLEAAGIPSADISMVGNDPGGASAPANGTEAGASVGAVLGGGAGLLAGLGMLAIPGLGPVVAAGWLAAAAVGAVAGGAAGGLVGMLTDAGVSEREATVYAEGVRRGATLVSARVSDEQAPIAGSILARNNPVNSQDLSAPTSAAAGVADPAIAGGTGGLAADEDALARGRTAPADDPSFPSTFADRVETPRSS